MTPFNSESVEQRCIYNHSMTRYKIVFEINAISENHVNDSNYMFQAGQLGM